MSFIAGFQQSKKRLNWPTDSAIITIRDLSPIKLGKDKGVNILPPPLKMLSKMTRERKKTSGVFLFTVFGILVSVICSSVANAADGHNISHLYLKKEHLAGDYAGIAHSAPQCCRPTTRVPPKVNS